MLTNDHQHLQIFEMFEVDQKLPKFKIGIEKAKLSIYSAAGRGPVPVVSFPVAALSSSTIGQFGSNFSQVAEFNSASSSFPPTRFPPTPGEFRHPRTYNPFKWLYWRYIEWKLRAQMERINGPSPKPKLQSPTLTVEELFKSIENSAEELKLVNERAAGYELAIENTVKNQQTALAEKLIASLQNTRSEIQLLAIGMSKYLTEETVVEFVKKCERGLRLDWMKNFTRIIPDEVCKQKEKADSHHIFDNYVVLHFDPNTKSYAKTEAELEKERQKKADPILFGVNRSSRRLYFVGDWVDELCDLTLDQIADNLGKKAVEKLE